MHLRQKRILPNNEAAIHTILCMVTSYFVFKCNSLLTNANVRIIFTLNHINVSMHKRIEKDSATDSAWLFLFYTLILIQRPLQESFYGV